MTDVVALPSTAVRASGRSKRSAMLGGAVLGGAFAGLAIGRMHAADPAEIEGALILLLRFMAVCKAAGALGAAVLMAWRLGRPLGETTFAIYLGALASMAAAPGLIWSLGLVAPGAILFHAGLLMFLVAAVRDDGVPALFVSGRRRG